MHMAQAYVIWALNMVLLFLILFRGIRNGILHLYPVFYGYMSFSLTTSLGNLLVVLLFGFTSAQYYYSFHLPNTLIPFLQLWLLWDLYRRSVGYANSSWKDLLRWASLVAVTTAPIAWKVFSMKRGDPFMSYHALTLPLQVVACLLVYRKVYSNNQLDLGRNLKGILLGISIMVALQSINFGRYVFVDSPFQIFGFFVPFIYLMALLIFAYALWDYVPMRRLKPFSQDQFSKVNDQLEQVLKSLLLR